MCMIFAGVLKCVNRVGKGETGTSEPVKPVVETMEIIEESVEQSVEHVDDSEEKESPAPVKTAVPTMVPTSKPTQKQEEASDTKDSSQSIGPTEFSGEIQAPKETPASLPQNTPVPIPQDTPVPIIPDTPAPTPQVTPTPIPVQEPAVEEEVHSHEFEKFIWELPTCGKGGYYNNVCKICGFVECVSLEPLSHETEDIVIQEGNCMEDKVIRHVCKICGEQTESDTRYPEYDKHQWGSAEVDGVMVEYCEQCGITK